MEFPQQFGKYTLLKCLATGGMAEIFLARQRGVGGFEKDVVVKRLLPEHRDNEELVGMFLDEARIAANLTHPNIAQIFDLGREGADYFIAMEYVRGQDLRRVCAKGIADDDFLPLHHAVRIIAEVCDALDYAHSKTDDMGQPMAIVHRDVSPTNILVTYDGGVKLVDFGIAKAASKATVTRAGQIKGKYGYMSPEQARGGEMDARTDIFAVGINLYEITLGRRLFRGDSDVDTLAAIEGAEVERPTAVNGRYPERLERVVMRALARDPDDRYDSARDMLVALEDFLAGEGLRSTAGILAEYMRGLFREQIEIEQQETTRLRALMKAGAAGSKESAVADETKKSEEPPAEASEDAAKPAAEAESPAEPGAAEAPAEAEASPEAPAETGEAPPAEAGEAPPAEAAAPAEADAPPAPKPAPATPQPAPEVAPQPQAAPQPLTGHTPPPGLDPWGAINQTPAPNQPTPRPRPIRDDLPDFDASEPADLDIDMRPPKSYMGLLVVLLMVTVGAAIFWVLTQSAPPPADRAAAALPLQQTRLQDLSKSDIDAPPPPPPKKAMVRIKTDPPGARLVLNGNLLTAASPTATQSFADGTVTVQAWSTGFVPAEKTVEIKGDEADVSLTLEAGKAPTGSLYIETAPPGATVNLAGVAVGDTPLKLPAVTADAELNFRIIKDGFYPHVVTYTVTPEGHGDIGIRLVPDVGPRKMAVVNVESIPMGARVTQVKGPKPEDRKRVGRTGQHALKINAQIDRPLALEFEASKRLPAARYIDVREPYYTLYVRMKEPQKFYGTLSVAGPRGLTVYVGPEEIGKTPIRNQKIEAGEHTVVVVDEKNRTRAEKVITIEKDAKASHKVVMEGGKPTFK